MAIADPLTERLWSEFPPSPTAQALGGAGVADPESWRRDGTLDRLAERVAMRCEYASPDKDCRRAAAAILRQCGGDLAGILAAYDRQGKARAGCDEAFFVTTARLSPPFWQVKYVVSEYRRGAPKPRDQFGSAYRQFIHGTPEHEAYRKIYGCEVCDRADASDHADH